MIIGVSMGLETCLIFGQYSHNLLYWKKKLPTDIWPDRLWPELWTKLGRNAKLREKQKWSNEKPKLDNAGRFRGIYFFDPEDKEFKEIIRNARKKFGNTNDSRYALQDMQEKFESGDP